MKLTLRVIAISSFIIAIAWMFYSPGFEPLLAFFAGITTLILSFVGGEKETETLDQRNRRILLNHVENFWVKGVLEKSLHGAAMLELGIKEDPEAVTYPWAIKKEETGETLPAGISMLEIFEQIGNEHSLLILGAPGSGKTTMLLELARQLIERARQNEIEPIPMVFNLASWTEKLSLADWLARELNNIYYVPRKTALDWVKGNKLLLLLDGLDEVRQESRTKCVDAINQFRKEHGLTSLAVCSRSLDYEEIEAKLAFEGAIEVQPLTQKQVSEFFNRLGKEMAGLKGVLKKDGALREMAETPLFLSIMIMAYRDRQDVDILASKNVDVQREHLFDTYIQQMFERVACIKNELYNPEKAKRWLAWLAQKMIEQGNSSFLLERIRRGWLQTSAQRYQHRSVIILFMGLLFGLFFGLAMGMVVGDWGAIIVGAIYGMLFIMLYSIFFSFRKVEFIDDEEPTELLIWSWKNAWNGPDGWADGWLTSGLIFGIGFGLVGMLISGVRFGIVSGVIGGLAGVLTGGLIKAEIITKTIPNQGIRQSIKNAILGGLAWAPFGALVGVLVGVLGGKITSVGINPNLMLFHELRFGVMGMLIFGLFSGGLKNGGTAIMSHYTLRFFLYLQDHIPWNYILFLDHCVDLIFLRRVGGGYIFVHRLLMEHFAAMYKE